jgi:hypothetical protein
VNANLDLLVRYTRRRSAILCKSDSSDDDDEGDNNKIYCGAPHCISYGEGYCKTCNEQFCSNCFVSETSHKCQFVVNQDEYDGSDSDSELDDSNSNKKRKTDNYKAVDEYKRGNESEDLFELQKRSNGKASKAKPKKKGKGKSPRKSPAKRDIEIAAETDQKRKRAGARTAEEMALGDCKFLPSNYSMLKFFTLFCL